MGIAKTFRSHGEAVEIQLTDAWECSPEDNGVALYVKGRKSGTLRIDVLHFEKDLNIPGSSVSALLKLSNDWNTPILGRDIGDEYVHFVKEYDEDGEALYHTYWYFAKYPSDSEIVVAVVSYAIEKSLLGDSVHAQDLAFVEQQVLELRWLVE